ncbi:MAG: DUF2905 family protein [Gemmatimonadota bacterium]
MDQPARLLIIFGLVLLGLGILFLMGPRIPLIGRLPGDFLFRRGGTTIYIPLVTSLILSILLSLVINLFLRR